MLPIKERFRVSARNRSVLFLLVFAVFAVVYVSFIAALRCTALSVGTAGIHSSLCLASLFGRIAFFAFTALLFQFVHPLWPILFVRKVNIMQVFSQFRDTFPCVSNEGEKHLPLYTDRKMKSAVSHDARING